MRAKKTVACRSRPVGVEPTDEWSIWIGHESRSIDEAIREILPSSGPGPTSLRAAMRGALFPGGKRLRPALAVLGHRILKGEDPEIYRLAASLELVHTFSLIHDDLPCMDDDDFRRGRPTCHRVYGEALAVLAGDALLNLAYETLIGLPIDPKRKERILGLFASAIGACGVLGGQVEDIEAEGEMISEARLRRIHLRKTASLISVSLQIGGELGGGGAAMARLERFGIELGLLFQLVDDLLNVEGSEQVLGRPRGSDEKHKKATFPRIVGLERSRVRMRRRVTATLRAARGFGRWSRLLESLVEAVVSRLPDADRLQEGL